MSRRSLALLCTALCLLAMIAPVHGAALASMARRAFVQAASGVADPVVDGAYVQSELARLVARDQHREAGQDTGLPPAINGHDEFAADWLAALRADLAGLPLTVTRRSFPLPGFRNRPPRAPGSNLIVTLPGASRPNGPTRIRSRARPTRTRSSVMASGLVAAP